MPASKPATKTVSKAAPARKAATKTVSKATPVRKSAKAPAGRSTPAAKPRRAVAAAAPASTKSVVVPVQQPGALLVEPAAAPATVVVPAAVVRPVAPVALPQVPVIKSKSYAAPLSYVGSARRIGAFVTKLSSGNAGVAVLLWALLGAPA